MNLKKLLTGIAGVMTLTMIFTSMAFAASFLVISDSVNVREAPNTNARVLGQVNANDVVDVLESKEDWRKIPYGNTYGWVNAQFLKEKGASQDEGRSLSSIVYTNTSDVNLRNGPDTDYGVMESLSVGIQLGVEDKSGSWTKVQTASGKIGWVHSKFLSTSRPVLAQSTENVSRGGGKTGITRNSDIRSKLVSFARKFLGVSYVYGGTSPGGFDCSGFVQYVFAHFGVDLERVAVDQARSNGSKVSKDELRPGDIVFYDTNGCGKYINHVGIYIGNGNMVHASSGRGEVTISDISDGFYARNYITGRRLLN